MHGCTHLHRNCHAALRITSIAKTCLNMIPQRTSVIFSVLVQAVQESPKLSHDDDVNRV